MGFTVAVEGPSGVGKTTVIQAIRDELQRRGYRVEIVNIDKIAPAAELQKVLRRPTGHPLRITALWAFRVQQHEMMMDLSQFTDVVLADRSWGTALAMDVFGNRVPREFLDWVAQYIKHQPDITFFLDAPMKVVRRRKKSESIRDTAFAGRVLTGYRKLSKEHGWIRVDATKSKKKVLEKCLKAILQHIERPRE